MSLTAALTVTLAAQDSRQGAELVLFGDAGARARIDSQARAIYEAAAAMPDRRVTVFTQRNALNLAEALGTDASGVILPDGRSRLIATAWVRTGRYSAEYYLAADELLFAYETFVYFEEAAPPDAWRNFLNQPAWERRSYFRAGQVLTYAESRGAGAPRPGTSASQLRQQAARVATLIEDSRR